MNETKNKKKIIRKKEAPRLTVYVVKRQVNQFFFFRCDVKSLSIAHVHQVGK